MSEAFEKRHRLTKRSQFFQVAKKGERKRKGALSSMSLSNEYEYDRLGISIRNAPSAVLRNLAKRRIREAFRKFKKDVQESPQENRDIHVVLDFARKPKEERADLWIDRNLAGRWFLE